jgi:glycosyltransferase involved in cell wall biosynthesis
VPYHLYETLQNTHSLKLKIGILGCRGIPNAYGGFEQFAEYLSVGLANKGHEVFVYNSSLHPYKKNKWQNVNIIHCSDWEDKLEAAGQFIYDLNCILDSRKRNFDILLQLGYTSNSVWHWLWPKKAINIVNMDGLEWKRSQYSKPVQKFIRKAEALAARYADHMVADSKGMQEYISGRYQKPSVYIPYAAEIFTQPDASTLNRFQLKPYQYYLVVSRLEPENNVEMIIEGYMHSGKNHELVIVGNMNKFGKQLREKHVGEKIKFIGAVYDKAILNNLRYFSKLHFHGHSVGGTNPSLLEAMACQSNIAAHKNIFNKAVLGNEAEYFSTNNQVTAILDAEQYVVHAESRKEKNLRKIYEVYNWSNIISAYENLMVEAIHAKADQISTSLVHQTA